jgi:hypothetical protein
MIAGAKAIASLVAANSALQELYLSANRLGCTWDNVKNEFINNPSGVLHYHTTLCCPAPQSMRNRAYVLFSSALKPRGMV